jgi:hypothetical protein
MFLDTLGSVLNQRETDLRVVIVANEPPDCMLPADPRIEVVQVGFPPATTLGRPSDVGIEADKGAKLGVGTSVAMRYQPTHLMFVDSDDFIHRDIATLAAAHPEQAGWFADSGYLHQRGSRSVRLLREGFHLRNGSTHVMRADILAVPDDIDPGVEREEVFERIGRGVVSSTMGRHRPIVGFFETLGTPLAPFPFPAAVWEIGTGENSSGSLAGTGARVALTPAIARDFAIPVPSRTTAAAQAVKVAGARVTRRVKRATAGGRNR